MKNHLQRAQDARQTPMWGQYLKGIGWEIETAGNTQLFIKKIPLFNVSFIKIEHPFGPYPLAKIDQIAKKHKAILIVFEPHEFNYHPQQLDQFGYQKSKLMYAHTSTIKIDLIQNEKELFNSFSENAKRNIRKAEKNNLKIRVVLMKDKKNWRYFEVFYGLLTNLSKIKKFYIPSRDEYRKKMTAFKEGSILLFAYEKNVPICVVWFACFDNVMAYFQTGITKRGYETLANYLLVWEGLKLAQKLKLSVFDFESIFDERFPKHLPEKKRYTDFKKRFHGEIVLYPQPWIKTYSRWGKILYLCSTLI